jgi:hypothetical protein
MLRVLLLRSPAARKSMLLPRKRNQPKTRNLLLLLARNNVVLGVGTRNLEVVVVITKED